MSLNEINQTIRSVKCKVFWVTDELDNQLSYQESKGHPNSWSIPLSIILISQFFNYTVG